MIFIILFCYILWFRLWYFLIILCEFEYIVNFLVVRRNFKRILNIFNLLMVILSLVIYFLMFCRKWLFLVICIEYFNFYSICL